MSFSTFSAPRSKVSVSFSGPFAKNSLSLFSPFAQRTLFTKNSFVPIFKPNRAFVPALQWKKKDESSLAIQLKTTRAASTTTPHTGKGHMDVYQKEYFHYSSIALVGLIPVALLLSPSSVVFPIDVALGFLIPFHGHLGMSLILQDYVTGEGAKSIANILLWVVSLLTALGLFRLNLSGPGLTDTVKILWKKKSDSIHQDR